MFRIDIEKATLKNNSYRKVIHTTPDMQLVLMKLSKNQTIPLESHHGTQFIRVERGRGSAIVDGRLVRLKDGVAIIIPPNTLHVIRASPTSELHLYTIYSPPQHADQLEQVRQFND